MKKHKAAVSQGRVKGLPGLGASRILRISGTQELRTKKGQKPCVELAGPKPSTKSKDLTTCQVMNFKNHYTDHVILTTCT